MSRRTPRSGPRRGARPSPARRNLRPGGRGTERARTATPTTRRPRFTHRMAVLVLVVAVLVVSYGSSMRAYLEQRAHLRDLRAQIATSQADIDRLEREKRRWDDPAYAEMQARLRFGWVLPGETSYQVIGKDGKPLAHHDQLTDPASVARPTPTPWWGKVYGSLQNADHPPVAPTPATKIQVPAPTG